MSDRTFTQIEFGGKISAALLSELVDLLCSNGLVSDGSDGSDGSDEPSEGLFHEARNNNKSIVFEDAECAGGTFEEIEVFCQRHGILFRRITDPHYNISGEIVALNANGLLLVASYDGATACLPFKELENMAAKGMGLASVLGEYFYIFCETFPPIEIVD